MKYLYKNLLVSKDNKTKTAITVPAWQVNILKKLYGSTKVKETDELWVKGDFDPNIEYQRLSATYSGDKKGDTNTLVQDIYGEEFDDKLAKAIAKYTKRPAQDAAELKRLSGIYETRTGKKPHHRMGIETLQEKVDSFPEN